MAFSRSVVRAQNIAVCQLCESERNIKWKCIECELLMCDKCRNKIHPKFRSAEDHTIIDIKDIGSTGGATTFTNIKCQHHTTQACCLFCVTCDSLVCPSCVSKRHVGHNFLEIKEVYDMKLERLKNEQKKAQKDDEDLTNKERKLNQIEIEEKSKYKKLTEDIQSQKDLVKRMAEQHAEQLKRETHAKLKVIEDSIRKEQEQVTTTRQKLKDWTNKADGLINTTDASTFFEQVEKLEVTFSGLEVPTFRTEHASLPKFVPGQFEQSNIGTMKEDGHECQTSPKIKMKVINKYTTMLNHIHLISQCHDGTFWICDNLSDILQKFKIEEQYLKEILRFNIGVLGMSLTKSNDLLLVSKDTSSIQEIKSNSRRVTDSQFKYSSLSAITVHVSSNQKIIVGAASPLPSFPVTGRRVVIVMDHTFQKEQTVLEHDSNNQPIFSYPWHITTTRDGTILVVDTVSDDFRGRIVILSPDTFPVSVNTYDGHPSINSSKTPFQPTRIATSPSDRHVVIDFSSNNLHILNNNGQLLTHYNTKNVGIEYSASLLFSSVNNSLFIGCSSKTGKAVLYEVKVTGC